MSRLTDGRRDLPFILPINGNGFQTQLSKHEALDGDSIDHGGAILRTLSYAKLRFPEGFVPCGQLSRVSRLLSVSALQGLGGRTVAARPTFINHHPIEVTSPRRLN